MPNTDSPSSISPPQLIALLVGINDYQPPVAPLQGCVNDVKALHTYLQEETPWLHPDKKILVLTNQQATKQAILDGFTQHLTQAGPNDVVLFYYSGHGTQEEARRDLWPEEEDGMLECLVCYDSVSLDNEDYRFLSDKELRYLLHGVWKKTGAEVTTLFDCCHSGDNTRSFFEAIPRRMANGGRAFPGRAPVQFAFYTPDLSQQLRSKPLAEVLPEGEYVQLAACQNHESAWEVGGSGVFTSHLLKVLRQYKGSVTWSDLHRSVQYAMRSANYQTPQMLTKGDTTRAYERFLKNPNPATKPQGRIFWQPDEQHWILDMGSIYGINPGLTITVLTVDDHSVLGYVRVSGVETTRSTLESATQNDALPKMEANAGKHYIAQLEETGLYPIRVFWDGVQPPFADESFLLTVDQASEANYCVGQDIRSNWYLYQSGDTQKRPVLELTQDSRTLHYEIKHLAQYFYARYLHNPGTFLFHQFPLAVTGSLLLNNTWQDMPQGDVWPIPFTNTRDLRKLQVQIKSQYEGRLYTSALLLGSDFSVTAAYMPGSVVQALEKDQSFRLETRGHGPVVFFGVDPSTVAQNRPIETCYLLIIASTDDQLDVSRLLLNNLPLPGQSTTRGNVLPDELPKTHDWVTRLVTIQLVNPAYRVE